jgi:hypothetical protein
MLAIRQNIRCNMVVQGTTPAVHVDCIVSHDQRVRIRDGPAVADGLYDPRGVTSPQTSLHKALAIHVCNFIYLQDWFECRLGRWKTAGPILSTESWGLMEVSNDPVQVERVTGYIQNDTFHNAYVPSCQTSIADIRDVYTGIGQSFRVLMSRPISRLWQACDAIQLSQKWRRSLAN